MNLPAKLVCSPTHFDVLQRLCQIAHGQGPFWKWMLKNARVKAHSQHGPYAIGEVMKHCHRQTIRGICSIFYYILHHGIGDRAVPLTRLSAWSIERRTLLERLPSDIHRRALDDLFAIASYAWFIEGRPLETIETKARNDQIAGVLPILPESVASLESLMAIIGHWWKDAKDRDPGPILVTNIPGPAAEPVVHNFTRPPTVSEPVPATPSLEDVPIHRDLHAVFRSMCAIPELSAAWSDSEIARFHALIDATAQSVRERSSAARHRVTLATAIQGIAEMAPQLAADDDVDRLVQARVAIWLADRFRDAAAAATACATLRQALDQMLVARAATDQMSGLTRAERLHRAQVYDTACTAAQACIQAVDALMTTAASEPVLAPVTDAPPTDAEPPVRTPIAEPPPAAAPMADPTPPDTPAPEPPPVVPVAVQEDTTTASPPPVDAAASPPKPQTAPTPSIDPLAVRIWDLAACGELILAGHLAQVRHRKDADASRLPAWLFHGPIVARTMSGYDAGAAEVALIHEICNDYHTCWRHDGHPDWNTGCRLLLAASLLRPAILMPQTGATAVLHDLHLDGCLRTLICDGIADISRAHIAIGIRAIKGTRHAAAQQAAVEALRLRAEAWIGNAGSRRSTGPVRAIWDDWSRPDQELRTMLDLVRRNQVAAVAQVRDALSRWTDERWFKNHIEATDRRIHGNFTLEAWVGRQLYVRCSEVIDICQAWLAAITDADGDSRHDQDLQVREAERIRRCLRHAPESVGVELAGLASHQNPCIRAGGLALGAAMRDIQQLFDADAVPAAPVPFQEAVRLDLLRIVDLELDADGHIDADADPTLVANVFTRQMEERAIPDLADAIRVRIAAGDIRGAERGLASGCLPLDVQARLQQACDEAHAVERTRLRQESDRILVEIEDVARQGTILSELDYQHDKAEVVTIQSRLGRRDIADFRKPHRILAEIRGKLRSARDAQIARLHQRLAACQRDGRPITSEDPLRRAVEDALARGNIIAAHEYLEQIEEGLPIQMVDDPPVCAGFPDRHDRIHAYLTATPTDRQLAAVQHLLESCHGGTAPSPLHAEDAGAVHPQANDLIESWWLSRGAWRQGGDTAVREEILRRILIAIGFQNIAVHADGDASRAIFDVETRAIQDRRVIPVSAFGSAANGRYHVLVVTTKHAQPADVVAQVHDIWTRGAPAHLLILLFQPWSAEQRQEMARLACGGDHPATFLVIDDVLVIGAALQRDPLLTALMRASIPFSYVRPYVDLSRKAPGPIPAEIFYGRRREREAILDGASLVYGGRQLGKTALLKEIERLRHNPAQGQIAIYINLDPMNQETILDDIWLTIATKLREKDVIPDANAAAIGPEKLFSHIVRFLQTTSNRILLLLDEADRLLEHDGALKPEPWAVLRQLKNWMQETERRFHVVFAGLHAVQRTALGNNPLAHLGEDICIGPLRDRDAEAARRLVVEPLALLGYRFETPDLVTRILSQANFYPSLIQLSCYALVDRLHAQRAKRSGPPPYVITATDVDETYGDPTLRKAIAEKFQITLNLDNRFRIIALAIALCDMDEERSRTYRTEDIQNLAMSHWPQGFVRAKTPSAFRGLLTELVGLGVLRQSGEDEFALRNLNIVPLLGNRTMIAQQLREAQDRKPDLPPDPKEARRSYDRSGTRVRAPITGFNQELIRGRKRSGVIVICGGSMAGAGQVPGYLTATLASSTAVRVLRDPSSLQVFDLQLREAFRERSKDSGTVVVVTCSVWDESWIRSAWTRVAKVSAKERWLRVVLLLAPEQAWKHRGILALEKHHLKEQGQDRDQDLDYARITLEPWSETAIHDHFIEDRGLSTLTIQQERDILDMTGGWPWFIDQIPRHGVIPPDEAALDLITRIETDPAHARHVLEAYDCPADARRLIAIISGSGVTTEQWGPRLAQALACSEDQARDIANRLREWLVHFDYARPAGKGVLTVDARLAEAVKRIATNA